MIPRRNYKASAGWKAYVKREKKVATRVVKKEEKKQPVLNLRDYVAKMISGLSGYSTYQAIDPRGTNLATGLGCTLMGFTGIYRISCIKDALAIRIAAKQKNPHAVYVLANLANMEYDPDKLDFLLKAGWKILKKMPGAHSSSNPTGTSVHHGGAYTSCLMGAMAAKDEVELMKMVEEELKLVDEAQFPIKD